MSKYVEEFWKEAKPEDFLKNRDRIVRVRNGHIGWSGPTKLDGFTLYTDKDKVTWYANGSLYDECQMYDPHSGDKKIEQFWRDATSDDVAMMMQTNEMQYARFRNRDDEGWQRNAKLMGCCIHWGRKAWMDEDMTAWKQCQVYDPPASKIIVDQLRQGYVLDTEFVHHPRVGDIVVFPGGLTVTAIEKGFTLVKHG